MEWKFTLNIILVSLLSMIMLAANAAAARVRVAIPSTTHAVLAFSTSRDKGYYRDEGLDLKEAPPLSRIFDFSIARKVMTDLQTKGWKPGA